MKKEEKEYALFNKVVKLMLILQASLEQMDDLKSTSVYKQSVRNSINNLEVKLERYIGPFIKQMGSDEEFIMMQIQRGVDEIVNNTIEDIHNQTTTKDE